MTSSTDKINQWVRPELRALQAYHVPEAGDLIKLDAMENPYCWPQWLVDAWLEELRGTTLNRYPDPAAGALKTRLRTVLDVPGDCNRPGLVGRAVA
jgi:histidinol-phosphate aminotransferase